MTGQNIGAGKPDRAGTANHFAAKASFLVLAAMGVIVFFTAPAVVSVFSDDPQVVTIGAEFLRWVAPTFGFIGIVRAYSGGFRGSGKVVVSASLAILMLGFLRLPVSWVASRVVDISVVSVSIPGVGAFETTAFANTLLADAFAYSLGSRASGSASPSRTSPPPSSPTSGSCGAPGATRTSPTTRRPPPRPTIRPHHQVLCPWRQNAPV